MCLILDLGYFLQGETLYGIKILRLWTSLVVQRLSIHLPVQVTWIWSLLWEDSLVKAMVFPGVVWMWELNGEESWEPKNWCFWTVVLEKTLESLLDCKKIQPVHPKGDQSWVFIGRTDVEAETPILWPPDGKSWLIGKDPNAGKDWGQEEKGTTEDEVAGCHHRLDGLGFG